MVRPAPFVLAAVVAVSANLIAGPRATGRDAHALQQFLNEMSKPPASYRAFRTLEASSANLKEAAWLSAWTEYDAVAGFRYEIAAAGGSRRIRDRVLKKVLEAEKDSFTRWQKGALSQDNYGFQLDGTTADGAVRVSLIPRRRDPRLIAGSVLLADSGALLSIEGRLSKSPSFWVKWVDVHQQYLPIGGVAMPVSVESVADVRIAGRSQFTMHYDYERVNGLPVASSDRTTQLFERSGRSASTAPAAAAGSAASK